MSEKVRITSRKIHMKDVRVTSKITETLNIFSEMGGFGD